MRTQAGSYRLAIAIRYWHSARVIISNQIRPGEYMEPVGYLLAMAAELILKAFLIDRGIEDKTLSRQIGHDLGAALKLSIERGLAVSEQEARALLAMREPHLSHFNRYGPKALNGNVQLGAFLLADDNAALQAVAMTIDRVSQDPKALRTMWQHLADLDWPVTLPLFAHVNLKKLAELEAGMRKEVSRIAALNAQFGKMGIPTR